MVRAWFHLWQGACSICDKVPGYGSVCDKVAGSISDMSLITVVAYGPPG